MKLGPSFGHVLGGAALFGVGAGLWMLGLRGPHWFGAGLVVVAYVSRELAQKWRSLDKPGPPLTMDNVRQAGWPSILAVLAATVIELVHQHSSGAI